VKYKAERSWPSIPIFPPDGVGASEPGCQGIGAGSGSGNAEKRRKVKQTNPAKQDSEVWNDVVTKLKLPKAMKRELGREKSPITS
jgi:hypothetical protein